MGLAPLKPTRNHQVNDEKVFAFEFENDLLSQAANRTDFPSDQSRRRRIDRTQYERTRNPDAFERLIQQASLKRFDIDNNVR